MNLIMKCSEYKAKDGGPYCEAKEYCSGVRTHSEQHGQKQLQGDQIKKFCAEGTNAIEC